MRLTFVLPADGPIYIGPLIRPATLSTSALAEARSYSGKGFSPACIVACRADSAARDQRGRPSGVPRRRR